MSEREKLIENLKSAHAFPGPYTFKIIGANTPDFLEAVTNALNNFEIEESTQRLSKNANHVSLSIRVVASTPESILDAYEVLSGLDGVKYVL